jgi:hypothetical protein
VKSRREFIAHSAALTLGLWLSSCWAEKRFSRLTVSNADQDASLGHRLRTMDFPTPGAIEEVATLIIGAGVSGLTAARELERQGYKDYRVVELSQRLGGNAASTTLGGMHAPLGAHYLPLVNNHNSELMAFLQEIGMISGLDAEGLPIYHEEHIIHAPNERLFIKGTWEEGLIPQRYMAQKDAEQFKRFLTAMDVFRNAKGSDGAYVFDLPMRACTKDTEWNQLDTLSMAQWLQQEGYDSEFLWWYINYSCRDDFGSTVEETSAWAGIHYFACRKGQGSGLDRNDVLTWPEGNARLVQALCKDISNPVEFGNLVYDIKSNDRSVDVFVYQQNLQQSVILRCKSVIGALPFYLSSRYEIYRSFPKFTGRYAPWVVANIWIKEGDQGIFKDHTFWDNVVYGAPSLGYIQSGHQLLQQHQHERLLTYYWALTGGEEKNLRQLMHERTMEDWSKLIIDELRLAHPDIESTIEKIELKFWGHAMLKPLVGHVKSIERIRWQESPCPGYFAAHSDHGGMSLFEEAFDQGLHAARECLQYLNQHA